MVKKILLIATFLTAFPSIASNEKIKQALDGYGVRNMEIKDSPITGLKAVVSDQGIFYATEDGKYFLQGVLVELTPTGPVDHTNKILMDKMDAMTEDMIVYPAKNEKYVVNVFTDITCGYCVKLHQEVKSYNDKGITIRYLAFPRMGASSLVAAQMGGIWQAKDKQAALTQAKLSKKMVLKPVKSNIVQAQYNLGQQFGISATPTLVLSNGAIVEGYRSPDDLLELLRRSLP